MSGRLDGRVALVTGGGSGIGRAVVRRLAAEGASVAVVDVDPGSAGAVVREVGDAARAYPCDVADAEAAGDVVAAVASDFGRLNIVHANAGILRVGSAESQSLMEWDDTMAVNVRGVFATVRAAIPRMLEQDSGAIIVSASTAGLVGEPDHLAYCASKGALISLARQLAVQYSGRGIRVNALCPGWIDTGFGDPAVAGLSEAEIQGLVEGGIPMGRTGSADECAAAVAFLASDDASYVSGHALVVDGAATAA